MVLLPLVYYRMIHVKKQFMPGNYASKKADCISLITFAFLNYSLI
jgi:hypothetical protein